MSKEMTDREFKSAVLEQLAFLVTTVTNIADTLNHMQSDIAIMKGDIATMKSNIAAIKKEQDLSKFNGL